MGGGLGLVRAAGGRDIGHSSLHSWRSQVAARTIFSSPGVGRGAAGRDEIELVGGEREESRSVRTQAAVPPSSAVQSGVWGSVWVGAASARCLMGLSEAQIKRCFPVSRSPYSCAQLSPPRPSLALSAALTLPRLSQETVGVTESWGGSGEGGCWITTERGRREAKDRAGSKPPAAAAVASARPTHFTDRCASAGALWAGPASTTLTPLPEPEHPAPPAARRLVHATFPQLTRTHESCHRLLLEIQAPGRAAHLGGVRCRGRVRVWKLRVQAPHSGAPRLGGGPHGSGVGAAASPGAGGEPQGEGAGLL